MKQRLQLILMLLHSLPLLWNEVTRVAAETTVHGPTCIALQYLSRKRVILETILFVYYVTLQRIF